MKPLACALMLGLAAPALAAPDPLAPFAAEPTVGSLQRAAAQLASLEPGRVRGWLRRLHSAALLPALRVRVGRGPYYSTSYESTYATPITEGWRFEVDATWSLERLVFDHDEIGVARESQRLAMRREQLLTEVAQLYFARRRLQVEALSRPSDDAEGLERRLAIDELTAVLDGLTGGALSAGRPPRPDPSQDPRQDPRQE
jgi:hypothetical protein